MVGKNILGCYVSSPMDDKDGSVFRSYIWGENSLTKSLQVLQSENYGIDMELILFQFYVKPVPYLLENIKEIENYRKKEKAIGIPIIINQDNFFSKSEAGKLEFLKQSILQKLDILSEVVKKKKLDTNIELLKSDLINIFNNML